MDPCCKRQLRTTMTNTWRGQSRAEEEVPRHSGGGDTREGKGCGGRKLVFFFFLFIFQRFPLQWGRQLGTGCESLNRVIPREPITLDPIEGVVMCRVGHKSGTPKH